LLHRKGSDLRHQQVQPGQRVRQVQRVGHPLGRQGGLHQKVRSWSESDLQDELEYFHKN